MKSDHVQQNDTSTHTSLSEKELCPDALLAGQEAAYARDIARLQALQEQFITVPCPACNATTQNTVFSNLPSVFYAVRIVRLCI